MQELDNAGVAELAALTRLTHLGLAGANGITDAAAHHLAALSQLRHLDLSGAAQLTDAALAELATMTQLTHLNLNGARKLTGQGARQLRPLRALCFLGLMDSLGAAPSLARQNGGSVDEAAVEELRAAHPEAEIQTGTSPGPCVIS